METEDRLVGGRYRLQSRLGSGGMGTVWRATDVVLGREVAVKEVTFPHGTRGEDAAVLVERTRREARSAARLDHPSAVTVYDVVEEDGRPWLVLELVVGRSLADVVAEGPLPPARVAQVGLAVLGALEAAHAQGIVHRDVKPGNVLVRPPEREDGRVVLTDFGIATSSADPSITGTGLLLGSPSYIAPERARGQAPGPASDLWSLGATLFTAVEGRPPYDEGQALLTVTAVVSGQHAPYVAAGALEPVIAGLLERDPELRLTAAQARPMLEDVASGRVVAPVVAAQPEPESERRAQDTSALQLGSLRRPPRTSAVPLDTAPARGSRGRTAALVGGAAALVLLAGGGYAVSQAGDDADSGVAQAPGTSAAPTPAPSGAPAPGSPTEPAEPASPASPTGPAAPTPTAAASTPPAAPTPAPTAAVEPAAVPAGYVARDGSEVASTVVVPASYEQSAREDEDQYRDPQTRRTLRVGTAEEGGEDAVADRQAQARSFAARNPSYSEIGISPADYRGYEAADWEFTYSAQGADLRVFNRVFVVDGRGYSLYFQAPAAEWDAAQGDLQAALDGFQTPSA